MDGLRNRWILLGSLGSVFLITLMFSHGPGYFGNFLAALGGGIEEGLEDSPMSPKVSPSDMVTKMVTSKPMVTKSNVTNVTSMSPQKSPDIKASQSSSPMDSPYVSMVTSSPEPTSIVFTSSPSPSAIIPSVSPSATPEVSSGGKVVISEIGWMGTGASASDEWIELFNSGSSPVNLDGWHLRSSDNSPNVSLSGIISAQGYYLIERTDDTAISDIQAHLISSFGTGGLNNSGENLMLIDASGIVQDGADARNGWFAGNNADKTSMERVSPEADGGQASSWVSNNKSIRNGHDKDGSPINGTPGAANSSGAF